MEDIKLQWYLSFFLDVLNCTISLKIVNMNEGYTCENIYLSGYMHITCVANTCKKKRTSNPFSLQIAVISIQQI